MFVWPSLTLVFGALDKMKNPFYTPFFTVFQNEVLLNSKRVAPGTPVPNDEPQPNRPDIDPANSAAVRHFRQGENMRYSFVIYNPRLDPATSQPQLQTQIKIFRDGQPVFTGRLQRFTLNNPPDITRLSAASAIKLGADMTPGDYVLQVIVTDLLAGEKYATASRWVDFKIVP